MNLTAGHCTVYCGCCENARDFKLDDELRSKMERSFDLYGGLTGYSQRLILASFLGLMTDNFGNPFDHIQERPAKVTEEADSSDWTEAE